MIHSLHEQGVFQGWRLGLNGAGASSAHSASYGLSAPWLTLNFPWCSSSSNFDSLNEDDTVENNQLAFDVAKREFGILPVTTGKEMASTQEPDKLSMVMYLSKFYELFRGTPLRPMGKHV